MSEKYSSDNKMQKLFEGFRKSVSEEGINEDESVKGEEESSMNEGSYEDEIRKLDKGLERHMARKAAKRMSEPSTRSYTPSGEYAPRPEIDMKDLMRSVGEEIRRKGGNVTIKITDKETGEVTEL